MYSLISINLNDKMIYYHATVNLSPLKSLEQNWVTLSFLYSYLYPTPVYWNETNHFQYCMSLFIGFCFSTANLSQDLMELETSPYLI